MSTHDAAEEQSFSVSYPQSEPTLADVSYSVTYDNDPSYVTESEPTGTTFKLTFNPDDCSYGADSDVLVTIEADDQDITVTKTNPTC
jgi:hypothetical protein